MPFKSEDQRKAMYAAAEGRSTIGIPEEVGKKFVAHRNDNDGQPAEGVLPEITELQVMQAIRDGALPSPQQYGQIHLFDIRVTGTGYAERATGEIGFKSPVDYLTPEFLERSQGLPVVWEHPSDKLLDTDSFQNQIIGTSVLPYVKGDEVWTIARIYDGEAAKLMKESQLSTSPAVSVSKSAVKMGNILIEGKPVYVDHIAICQNGVWDKGKPDGVRLDSITHEDKTMEEEKGEGLREAISKMLDEHSSRIDAKFDEVHNRLDEMGGKKGEEVEIKDDELDPVEKEEVKEEIEETEHVVDSSCDGAANRMDSEKRDDDDVKADSMAAMKKELDSLRAELKRDRQRMAAPTIEDKNRIADALSRADSVLLALGETNTVSYLPGEGEFNFRKRIASTLSKYSDRFKKVDVSKVADKALFEIMEDQIYADAMSYAKAPPIAPGRVHMIEQKGIGGRSIFVPSANSDPHGWMDVFSHGAQFTGGFKRSN